MKKTSSTLASFIENKEKHDTVINNNYRTYWQKYVLRLFSGTLQVDSGASAHRDSVPQ